MTTPDLAAALFFDGVRKMSAGELPAAEAAFQAALAVQADLGEAHTNLALLCEQRGARAVAEQHFRQALACCPESSPVHANLATFLLADKRFDEAEALARQAVALAPEAPVAWSNLGVVLACRKAEVEAEQCYRTALALDPEYAKAHFNLAYLLLRQGHFAEGWRALEAREWYPALAEYFACPCWQGEPLAGRNIIVTFEVGHGDMIQFCRYLPMLKAQGVRRLGLLCQPALQTLLGSLPGVDVVYAPHDDVPRTGWDYWSPPLSLPRWFNTDLDSIPVAIPYLFADPQRCALWQARLDAALGPAGRERQRVALVWKGNPAFENDADRSLPALASLAPLGELSGIDWISLQKGAGEDEAYQPPVGLNVLPLGAELMSFADTAAVLSGVDLLISVDTAAAHLAGALGKPCWLLLPEYKTDWRWLVERTDTPWYPAMRLFRQRAGEDWAPAIARLRQALLDQQQEH